MKNKNKVTPFRVLFCFLFYIFVFLLHTLSFMQVYIHSLFPQLFSRETSQQGPQGRIRTRGCLTGARNTNRSATQRSILLGRDAALSRTLTFLRRNQTQLRRSLTFSTPHPDLTTLIPDLAMPHHDLATPYHDLAMRRLTYCSYADLWLIYAAPRLTIATPYLATPHPDLAPPHPATDPCIGYADFRLSCTHPHFSALVGGNCLWI